MPSLSRAGLMVALLFLACVIAPAAPLQIVATGIWSQDDPSVPVPIAPDGSPFRIDIYADVDPSDYGGTVFGFYTYQVSPAVSIATPGPSLIFLSPTGDVERLELPYLHLGPVPEFPGGLFANEGVFSLRGTVVNQPMVSRVEYAFAAGQIAFAYATANNYNIYIVPEPAPFALVTTALLLFAIPLRGRRR